MRQSPISPTQSRSAFLQAGGTTTTQQFVHPGGTINYADLSIVAIFANNAFVGNWEGWIELSLNSVGQTLQNGVLDTGVFAFLPLQFTLGVAVSGGAVVAICDRTKIFRPKMRLTAGQPYFLHLFSSDAMVTANGFGYWY